jgi:SAM-dependent methyltransferase
LTAATATALTFTGERFTPEVRGAIWYEHWHRYAVAVPLARGLRVLDAACGEGYGSALLARSAASVVGVDVDAGAVAHARERYARANLSFAPAPSRRFRSPTPASTSSSASRPSSTSPSSARCSPSSAACSHRRRADPVVAQPSRVQRSGRRGQPLPRQGARPRGA